MTHLSNNNAVGLGIFILLMVAVYVFSAAYRLKQQAALRKAVIDKFSSAQDFASFVQTPEGSQFLAEMSQPGDLGRTYAQSLQRGIVLLAAGAGLYWTSSHFGFPVEIIAIGILLMCVGAGVLLSAGVYLSPLGTVRNLMAKRLDDAGSGPRRS